MERLNRTTTREDEERMEKQAAELIENEKATYAERRQALAEYEDAKTQLAAATTYLATLGRWRMRRDVKQQQERARMDEREQSNA